jgi:dihydroorotate dehydrogenase electron transfer subunit
MMQHKVTIVENVRLAERTFRMRVADPEIGAAIRPGQFVMLRVNCGTDPLLARPFALYDTFLDSNGRPAGYDLVYLVVGKVTGAMSQLRPGELVEIWGPLGNGFRITPTKHLVMVAGGIGQTPFPAVARASLGRRRYGVSTAEQPGSSSEPTASRRSGETISDSEAPPHITLCYGVRNRDYLAGLEDFRALSIDVSIATDDGSAGRHGFVTELVQELIRGDDPPTRLMGCGPEPMMRALAQIATRAVIPCELSLETPMACGIGACFSCVARIQQDDGSCDYRRVCMEGPVFDAARVVF